MKEWDDTSWLDTETKAVLQKMPPKKLAPAETDAFAVVVLSLGSSVDRSRRLIAFDKVLRTSPQDAKRQLNRTPPFVLKGGLTMAEAMLAQFELACTDIRSIFLSEDLVANAESRYLATLYRKMLYADEFQPVRVRVISIPDTSQGQAFAQQFLGPNVPQLPFELVAMRKKARIMTHWADKIGATVRTTPDAPDS